LVLGAPGSPAPIIRYPNLADNISPAMPFFTNLHKQPLTQKPKTL
jgi:hypothetical protein